MSIQNKEGLVQPPGPQTTVLCESNCTHSKQGHCNRCVIRLKFAMMALGCEFYLPRTEVEINEPAS